MWERVAYPRGTLTAHLERTYPHLGNERLFAGGEGRVFGDATRLPLTAAERLERTFPADDQRYTPGGVFLRYERHIVAVLSDGRGGSQLVLMPEVDGYRHLHAYVGDFWGPRYHENAGVPPTALPVPEQRDVAALTDLLDEAETQQGVCYGWSIEIVSGRRRGPFHGDVPRVDADGRRDTCADHLVLEGWIDPNAGRFSRRGDPGDWSLGLDLRLPGPVPQAAFDAISVPFDELVEGATTEPSGSGERAGKGLIEMIGALPLLAEHAGDIPAVKLRRPDRAAFDARPAPAERSDAERRAEDSPVALPPALLRVGAVITLLLLVVLVPAGALRRLVRRRSRARARG